MQHDIPFSVAASSLASAGAALTAVLAAAEADPWTAGGAAVVALGALWATIRAGKKTLASLRASKEKAEEVQARADAMTKTLNAAVGSAAELVAALNTQAGGIARQSTVDKLHRALDAHLGSGAERDLVAVELAKSTRDDIHSLRNTIQRLLRRELDAEIARGEELTRLETTQKSQGTLIQRLEEAGSSPDLDPLREAEHGEGL